MCLAAWVCLLLIYVLSSWPGSEERRYYNSLWADVEMVLWRCTAKPGTEQSRVCVPWLATQPLLTAHQRTRSVRNREQRRHPSGWFGHVPFTLRLVPWLLSLLHLGKKTFPSSNQCLSLKVQRAVADLELKSLRFAAAESDFVILIPSEHEAWLLGLAGTVAGVWSVPCQMLRVPWCWHPPPHCSVWSHPGPRDPQHCWLAPGPRVLMKISVWHPGGDSDGQKLPS